MERRWTAKNVNLELLTFKLGDFFKERQFEVLGEKTPENYQITAANSPIFKILGTASVTIEGKPEDFTIKLEMREKRTRVSGFGSLLLRTFGGGYFYLQEVKSDEAWEKLEKEFWAHVENLILQLANTAKTSES